MKDEIKEILDDLKNKDCYINDETILTFDEASLLLDYITNLQEQQNQFAYTINELGKSNVNLQQRNIELMVERDRARGENKVLQDRRYKAIEYINKHTNNEVEYLDIIEVKELKNILEREDKDVKDKR